MARTQYVDTPAMTRAADHAALVVDRMKAARLLYPDVRRERVSLKALDGTTGTNITEVENGNRELTLRQAARWSERMRVPLDRLLAPRDPTAVPPPVPDGHEDTPAARDAMGLISTSRWRHYEGTDLERHVRATMKAKREELNLGLRAVAEQAGLAHHTSAWRAEDDEHSSRFGLRLRVLFAMCDVLGLDVPAMIKATPKPPRKMDDNRPDPE